MVAERPVTRDRRPAVWPWLLMPLVVLLVFYALFRMHHPGTPWAAIWADVTGARPAAPASE
jgi:hypothetical protein